MKFGHHGGNHPVKDIDNNVVMITAQNHGFAVDEASMPANLRVTHKSLFDGTLQGIHRTDKPAFSFQGIRKRALARTMPHRCSTILSN
jgi:carbamoyl-phosphate synthase small subunit